MALLTIYKPDGFSRHDESTEDCYLSQQPVDIGLDLLKEGISLRFLLPGRRATWLGELKLTASQAEKLKEEIDQLLLDFEPKSRVQ